MLHQQCIKRYSTFSLNEETPHLVDWNIAFTLASLYTWGQAVTYAGNCYQVMIES